MKRKILSVLILVMLLVTLIPGVASAEGNGAAIKIVDKGKNCSDVQFAQLERMVDKANKQIAQAVKRAQNTPFDDVAELLAFVDGIVAEVMSFADSIGAIVTCEYTTYIIDGQTVLIDPLRVIPL